MNMFFDPHFWDVKTSAELWVLVGLLIFIGILIPVALTFGPIYDFLAHPERLGEAMDGVSIIVHVPILISAIALIEGRKRLQAGIEQRVAGDQPSNGVASGQATQTDAMSRHIIAHHQVCFVARRPRRDGQRPMGGVEMRPILHTGDCGAEDYDLGADGRVPEGRRVTRRQMGIGRESKGPTAGPSPPGPSGRHPDPT